MIGFKRVIAILFTVILIPLSTTGTASPVTSRLVRPADPALRDRLATAHLVKGEPLEVSGIIPTGDGALARDFYNRGMALSLTGRFIKASRAFHKAMSASEPGSETRSAAMEQFIRLSVNNPGMELPAMDKKEVEALGPDLSLYLSGYMADRGNRAGALNILEDKTFQDERQKVISGLLRASHLAVEDTWNASARAAGRVRGVESSSLSDLLELTKGYHYLQAGQPGRARSSFTTIPPGSPYSPDALLGKAWSLIRADDLPGAAIVLEELVENHGHTQSAADGVLDLAVAYRELGLHDRAEVVLDRHLKRLREVRSWLNGLKSNDLLAGSDISVLLEGVLDGSLHQSELLARTPPFVRYWISEISSDPYVRNTTALLGGIEITGAKALKLRSRLDRDHDLVRIQISQVGEDIRAANGVSARLEEMKERLGSIGDDMGDTLQRRSLKGFANERAMMIITRTGELKLRLSLMENSVRKAEGFTSLVGKLSDSITASTVESELNRIRRQAYEGLISSRLTLRDLRESLTSLEGKLWLEVKGGAIDLERKTSLRVTSGQTRTRQALAENSRVVRLLTERRNALVELGQLLQKSMAGLDKDIPGRLETLRSDIDANRAARLLDLAAGDAERLRDAEARTLYTYADIEISRMKDTVRSLQEASQ